MKKTIVFMGSPRLDGNTSILTDKITEGIKSVSGDERTVEKVNLVDYQGYVCKGCGQCRPSGNCEQFDKVNDLLKKIKEFDGFVIGTPTWWMAPSSQTKIFTDHWGAFLALDYSSRIAGKKAIIVSCNGNPDINFAEHTCNQVNEMLKFLQIDVKGILSVKGCLEVDAILEKKEMLDKAFTLGANMYQ